MEKQERLHKGKDQERGDAASRAAFPLGQTVITPAAIEALTNQDVLTALSRHVRGDWGDLCDEDRTENDHSLREGFRLLSVYHTSLGTKFWVITEADRSVTTVLLPSDY
jgi:hypothetical protein